MATYQGLDLLTIPPNVRTVRDATVSRVVVSSANAPGNVLAATTDAAALETVQLDWHCTTRADLVTLETFLQARLGQTVACWVPSYQRDATIVSYGGGLGYVVRYGDTDLDALVVTPRYADWIELSAGFRGYNAIRVATVADLGDGTHSWQHSGTTSGVYGLTSAQGSIFCRLLQCRMASDSYRVTYHTGDKTTVSADFVEVGAAL